MKMKKRNTTRMILTLMIPLTFGLAGAVYSATTSAATGSNGSCETRQCINNMRAQLASLKAYVKRLKPGDKVIFNPQPDPPGEPAFRRAMQAYRSLQDEVSYLSKYPPGPCKGKCQDAIRNTQAKFEMLSRASNGASASSAIAAMKPCIDELLRQWPPSGDRRAR